MYEASAGLVWKVLPTDAEFVYFWLVLAAIPVFRGIELSVVMRSTVDFLMKYFHHNGSMNCMQGIGLFCCLSHAPAVFLHA